MKWYKIFCFYNFYNRGWLRLFGIGISWKHIKYGLMFSERYGYKKYIKIGNYYFRFLKYAKL